MGFMHRLTGGLLTLLFGVTAILGAVAATAVVLWPLLMTHH